MGDGQTNRRSYRTESSGDLSDKLAEFVKNLRIIFELRVLVLGRVSALLVIGPILTGTGPSASAHDAVSGPMFLVRDVLLGVGGCGSSSSSDLLPKVGPNRNEFSV